MHVASFFRELSFPDFHNSLQGVWPYIIIGFRIQFIWHWSHPNVNFLLIFIWFRSEKYFFVNELSATHVKERLINDSMNNNIFRSEFFKFLYNFYFFIPFWSKFIICKPYNLRLLNIGKIVLNFNARQISIEFSAFPSCPHLHILIFNV